jgi:hypothetical protein
VITCSLSLSHPKFNIVKKHYMKRAMSIKRRRALCEILWIPDEERDSTSNYMRGT